MNLLRDCQLRTQQILRERTKIFARAYHLRPNNAGLSHMAVERTMSHAGTKSARPFIAPSSEPRWGLTLIEPLRPYYLGLIRRSRSDGRKLLIPSTSRTLVAKRGEPSTNLLANLDAPFTCATSRQNPSSRNLWGTRRTRPRIASPPSSSTRSCPTGGKFLHLRVTVSVNPFDRRSLLPSDAWNKESLLDWISSFQSLYSTPRRLSNLGFETSSVPACANSSGEEHLWLRYLSQKSHWGPKVFPSHISAFEILEKLIYARVELIIDPLLPQEQSGFRHGRSAVHQVTLLTQDIENRFSAWKEGRSCVCRLHSSPASCCDCCLTDTWSAWSWRWLGIAASPLPPETAKEPGYDASRTVSHGDLSWRPFSSTSTSLKCQPLSSESMHMLTT